MEKTYYEGIWETSQFGSIEIKLLGIKKPRQTEKPKVVAFPLEAPAPHHTQDMEHPLSAYIGFCLDPATVIKHLNPAFESWAAMTLNYAFRLPITGKLHLSEGTTHVSWLDHESILIEEDSQSLTLSPDDVSFLLTTRTQKLQPCLPDQDFLAAKKHGHLFLSLSTGTITIPKELIRAIQSHMLKPQANKHERYFWVQEIEMARFWLVQKELPHPEY